MHTEFTVLFALQQVYIGRFRSRDLVDGCSCCGVNRLDIRSDRYANLHRLPRRDSYLHLKLNVGILFGSRVEHVIIHERQPEIITLRGVESVGASQPVRVIAY